jgi:hypothetical protein
MSVNILGLIVYGLFEDALIILLVYLWNIKIFCSYLWLCILQRLVAIKNSWKGVEGDGTDLFEVFSRNFLRRTEDATANLHIFCVRIEI